MNRRPRGRGQGMNRREFVVATGGTVLAWSSIATFVHSVVAGAPRQAAHVAQPPLDDWSIDDMWTGYPRHAEPIGYAPPPAEHDLIAAAAPADVPFLA
jgi:hypothetical protein